MFVSTRIYAKLPWEKCNDKLLICRGMLKTINGQRDCDGLIKRHLLNEWPGRNRASTSDIHIWKNESCVACDWCGARSPQVRSIQFEWNSGRYSSQLRLPSARRQECLIVYEYIIEFSPKVIRYNWAWCMWWHDDSGSDRARPISNLFIHRSFVFW